MALDADHQAGETGHVADHNLIDNKLTDLQGQITSLVGSLPDATNSVKGRVILANDFGGSAGAPTVVATHLTAPLPIAQGGTAASAQVWVGLTGADTINGVKTYVSSPLVPTPSTSGQAVNKSYVDATVVAASGIVDATTSVKGKVKLANDIAGTADLPTVVATHLTAPLPIAQGGTAASGQVWVDLSTTQSVSGAKTFAASPTVPTPSASGDAANKGYVDSAGGTAAVVTHVNEYHPNDIRKFGAVSFAADNTTAITNALIAASGFAASNYMKYQTSGGNYMQGAAVPVNRSIFIPDGEWVFGNLVLPSFTSMVFESHSAIGVRKSGTSGDWITNRRDSTVHGYGNKLIGGTLHGNWDGQTLTGDAIHFTGDTTYSYTDSRDFDFDLHCTVQDMQILFVRGNGIKLTGSGENKIVNNFVRSTYDGGLWIEGFDNWIYGNSVGHSGTFGMKIQGDDNRVVANKCWFQGDRIAAEGIGYDISSDSGVGSGNTAQDCTAEGVKFDQAFGWTWDGCMIDSCSRNSIGTYTGMKISNSGWLNLGVTIRNRYRNNGTLGPTTNGVDVGSSNNLYGDIVVTQNANWGVTTAAYKAGSVAGANSALRVNGTNMPNS
jgi:hypothetical protein